MKRHVRLVHPKTLEEAISTAVEFEAVETDLYRGYPKPRAACLHEESPPEQGAVGYTAASSNKAEVRPSKLTEDVEDLRQSVD